MYLDYLEIEKDRCRSPITHKLDMRKWRHLRGGDETICMEGKCENLAEPIWWYDDDCDWQCHCCNEFSCKEHIVTVSWNDFHLLKNTPECDIDRWNEIWNEVVDNKGINMDKCDFNYEDTFKTSSEGTSVCMNCFWKVYYLKRNNNEKK